MRYVIALGGNALLQRGEHPDVDVQRDHARTAAGALAPVILAGHEVVVCHGNGPQIGMLAIESGDDRALREPFPLDTLGAQTQGMIGYWLTQELSNAGITTPVAVILTRTLVFADDPAFAAPTKFIGPVYSERQAAAHTRDRGWAVATDSGGWRRVVASPEPQRLLELATIARLVSTGTTVVCAGGGGAPVIANQGGVRGVEAVIDKDLAAALLATELDADRFVVLTDVDAVKTGFGTPDEVPLARATVAELRAMSFPSGSMGPKVEAAARFVTRTGRPAVIGSLADATAVIAGDAGTRIVSDNTRPPHQVPKSRPRSQPRTARPPRRDPQQPERTTR